MNGRDCRRMALWLGLVAALGVGCDDEAGEPSGPSALIDRPLLDGGSLVEVVTCRHSHEHELRHVRIFADASSADLYQRCVLGHEGCDGPFPPGALFVKYEYDREGCREDELLAYTVSLKLEPGALPSGLDWHWQKLDPKLRVTDDEAPPACVRCHLDHCAPPWGHDLRCFPD